ncbi:MAG: SLC13 family permease [Promethearchaeota archaeon]
MVVFSTEKIDYLVISLFGALLAAFILKSTYQGSESLNLEHFLGMIEWRPLIFIFSMQIVIAVSEKKKIFEYIAISSIQITKGNYRILFYLISTVSTLVAAVIADVTVSIIFAPLIIRTCKILEIKPAPYLFAMTICINIGSLITPFSSAENIMISGHFLNYNIDINWFVKNVFLFGIFLLYLTLFLLDRLMLKHIKTPDPKRINLVREILTPALILENKKSFYLNSIYLLTIFIAFFFTTEAYLVALLGAILMVLGNKEKIGNYFKDVEWNVIFFFASLYIIIGAMIENGTIEIINDFINKVIPSNILMLSIFILIMTSLFSGFLANSPTALMFLAIIDEMIITNESIANNPNLLIIALLIGINLGGNFLPQGAACDVMTLTIATKNKVEGFTYKTLVKWGATFALVHLLCGLGYLVLYYFIL